MVKPFDLTKFRKEQNKKLGIKDGFYDPITWIDTGNYALNKMISGYFNKGIPLGCVSVFAGEPAAGKSYIVSGNIVRNALEMGVTVILLDTEGALFEEWMEKLGVDTKHPNLIKYVKSTVNQIASVISDFMEMYIAENKNLPREEQSKVLFVVDSLGFVETDTSVEQFDKGELKGDKGIKAKALKMLVSNCIRLFTGYEVGLVATNHVYKSQDAYSPDDVISGGSSFIFAASIVVSMNKFKLKLDELGNKVTDIRGIRAKVKCVKSRFSKPYEEVELQIPWDTGMSPVSGLFDMFVSKNVLKREGNSYIYTAKDGSEYKSMRKAMDTEYFNRIINEWDDKTDPVDNQSEHDLENIE